MIFPEEDLEQQNVRLKDRNRSFASPVIGDVEEANAYGSSFHVMDLKTESVADLTYLQSQKNLTASTAASGTTTSAAAAGTAGTTASIAEEHQEHQDPSDGLALENSKKLEPIESSKQSTGKERLKKNQLKTKKESQDQEPSVLTESTSTITTGANSGLVEMERDKSSSDKINKHDLPPPTATTWDLYFLGLNIVMCGTLFTWNTGLAAGFWEYFFAMSITGIAYIFLICCLAEMASALPFHGGMYGFIRLTVGPYTGFFVGCCEIVQNILCVTTTVQPIGWMITEMTGWQAKYEPIYWVIFYVTALLICTAKEKIFWRFNAFIAILSIVLIVIFLLGSFPYVNYSKYSYRGHAFTASGVYFFDGLAMLENLPTASWLFMGVELVPLAGGSAIDVSLR